MSNVHAELKGVTRVYPARGRQAEVQALGPVDLMLRQGEFFSVVGPSGCGKSTLMDVLSGLGAPTDGTVSFEGKPVRGVVCQEDSSFPWLTVRDNVAFGLRRAGVAAKEIKDRVSYALSFMGLDSFAYAYPAQLSGGMRQRVCIARTLVMRPRLILMDEPFGALDQQTRLLMGDELLRLWRETGATVLFITHALDEAAMLSDRIGVMSSRPGRLIEVVETHWPRERDSRVAASDPFGHITAHLWSLLRTESLKAMGKAPEAATRPTEPRPLGKREDAA
jgi:NitT/TauT family transport system ATP-binding protein